MPPGGRSRQADVDSLPLPALIAVFGVAAAAVWFAGIQLSKTTDVLAHRLGLGEALGGLILLAVATNLPEIAITASAALAHTLGIAIGNILGGIALQTVVLAVIDLVGLRRSAALMYRAASLTLVLEAGLVIAVLVIVVMGTQLPSATILRVEPAALLIVAVWMLGLALIGRARRGLPWHASGSAPDGQPKPRGHSREQVAKTMGTARAVALFTAGALVTLAGGIALERSGEHIASHIGMTGVVFGATILAAATALPEVSTGLASVKLEDYQLAVSDIFGGNAFLPVLFLVADLLGGRAVLPQAQSTDIYLTALGGLLTTIYIAGLIFRPRRQVVCMGLDSAAVVVTYALGVVGLLVIARA
jgi:cation:H+ antiporter